MSWYPCSPCCQKNCSVYSQGEWYADDPRAANWVNVDSEWDMDATGQWMQTSDSGAELICKTPSKSAAQCITATAGGTTSPPGVMRLLGNVTVDGSLEPVNYIYAEFNYPAQSVSIGTKLGGVVWTRTNISISPNDRLNLWITEVGCSNKVSVSVAAGTQTRACEDYGWHCMATPGGLYAGLGSGSGGASFDDSESAFQLYNHSDYLADCCDCDCMCDDNCIPTTLDYTLTLNGGEHADCCVYSTGNMELDSQAFGGPGGICAWKGTASGSSCYYGDVVDFWIYNPSQERAPSVENIKAVFESECASGGDITPHTSSTCCPLYLRYDIEVCWEHPDEALGYQLTCNYTLEITE